MFSPEQIRAAHNGADPTGWVGRHVTLSPGCLQPGAFRVLGVDFVTSRGNVVLILENENGAAFRAKASACFLYTPPG